MLDQKLMEYAKGDSYPFHMPGHKRRISSMDSIAMDITEIGGFDNLHHPEGILGEAQQRAARLYGSDAAYYLVNGSTCGILAAISAAVKKGGKVLAARNCHKAVYHAIFLRELTPVYLYPQMTHQGLQGQVMPDEVEKELALHPDICAVILTSPTYDGIVSDIAGIAEKVHARDIPLIVDEAHGAHFGFSPCFPENAVTLGADAVIVSVHKTLPAYTQTALLHLCGERISHRRVEQFLDIYETSSPSYVLMGGIERCVRIIDEQRETLFAELKKKLDRFYRDTENLKNFHVVKKEEFSPREAYAFDESKILIFTDKAGIDGVALQRQLRERYHLELEMACGNYVLALTSVMDTEEGFARLTRAIMELDHEYEQLRMREPAKGKRSGDRSFFDESRRSRRMEIHEAWEYPARTVDYTEAEGEVSAVYLVPYPPGIPLIVPGEVIDGALIRDIDNYLAKNMVMEGFFDNNRISVVDFD